MLLVGVSHWIALGELLLLPIAPPTVPETLVIQTGELTFHERELTLCHGQRKAGPYPQLSRPDMVEVQTNQFSYHPSPHPEL